MRTQLLVPLLAAAGIAITAPAQGQEASTPAAGAARRSVTDAPDQVRITRVTPEYWRVTFHNPPFNIYGPNTTPQLNALVTAIEKDPHVKVVVFDSDVPGFFLSDFDEAEKILGEINAPNLRMQFDIYHAQIIHGDIARRLERQMPWIGHIQIANPPDRREPGAGEIDYDFIFARLDALGYDGWVGCEYRPAGDTEASLAWIRRHGVNKQPARRQPMS